MYTAHSARLVFGHIGFGWRATVGRTTSVVDMRMCDATMCCIYLYTHPYHTPIGCVEPNACAGIYLIVRYYTWRVRKFASVFRMCAPSDLWPQRL